MASPVVTPRGPLQDKLMDLNAEICVIEPVRGPTHM